MWTCGPGFKGCVTCHLFDGGVSFFFLPLGMTVCKAKCCGKSQPGGFRLKLTAHNKSKTCHSTTDRPELIHEHWDEPLSLPDSSM